MASAGTSAVSADTIDGYHPGVWVDSDGFTNSCLGQTDNYPAKMYAQATSLLSLIGFTSDGQHQIGHGFTRSAFLTSLTIDYGVYVHSHGDIFASSAIRAAFLQDPPAGRCNDYTKDYVSAAQVLANAHPPYNVVIMSTCYLGSMYQPHKGSSYVNLMPEAFGIPKTHVTSGNRFYMGYVYSTFDSAMYYFEQNFYEFLQLHPGSTLSQAWTTAAAEGPYDYPDSSDPFLSAWYGDWNLVG